MYLRNVVFLICILFLAVNTCNAVSDKQAEDDSMAADLETTLQLSKEKLSKLRPFMEERSAQLKQSLQESVDKGFVQMDKMKERMQSLSEDMEDKVQGLIDSEEMARLKEYLAKVDKDAIAETKDQILTELIGVLQLTEEQLAKVKPILEDGVQQLGIILEKSIKQGRKSLEEFKSQYDDLTERMRERLEKQLDKEQMDRFDRYNEERKSKIEKGVFV